MEIIVFLSIVIAVGAVLTSIVLVRRVKKQIAEMTDVLVDVKNGNGNPVSYTHLASYFVAVWKMLRKKGCVPSALTQNVKDLLASREIENILDNTDFMILLSQAQSDRTILAKQLGISEHQLSYITHSNSGEGLLFYGNVTIPFVDRFPRGEIYDLLTTRPEDMKNETKNE